MNYSEQPCAGVVEAFCQSPKSLWYHNDVSWPQDEIAKLSVAGQKIVVTHGNMDLVPSAVVMLAVADHLHLVPRRKLREPTCQRNGLQDRRVRLELILAWISYLPNNVQDITVHFLDMH